MPVGGRSAAIATSFPPAASGGSRARSSPAPPERLSSAETNAPAGRLEHRAQNERVAAPLGRKHEGAWARAERDAVGRDRAGGLDPAPELGRRAGGEVAAPAAEPADGRTRYSEQRHALRAERTGDVSREADDGRRLAEPRVAGERRRLANRHELREVLAHDRVARDGECGLVALSPYQRRAVRLGEQREADADRAEGGDQGCLAWSPRERERCESNRDGEASAGALEQAKQGVDDSKRHDRGDQRDQAGDEQQQRSRAARGPRRAGTDVAADEGDREDGDGRECREVDGGDRQHAELHGPRDERRGHDCSGAHRERERDEDARAGEHAVREDGAGRGPEVTRDERSEAQSQSPTDRGSRQRADAHLPRRAGEQLPAGGSRPGQALPRGLRLAPRPGGGEHGEGEEQSQRLSAEQQEPSRARSRPVVCGRELLLRRRDVERLAPAASAERARSIRELSRSTLQGWTSPCSSGTSQTYVR